MSLNALTLAPPGRSDIIASRLTEERSRAGNFDSQVAKRFEGLD